MQHLKTTAATIKSNIPVIPTILRGDHTEDVHTWIESIELVFLAK